MNSGSGCAGLSKQRWEQHLCRLDPIADPGGRLVALDDIYEELDHRSAVAGIDADLPDEFLVELHLLGVDVGLL